MSKVRLLVGTRKGASILTADGKRKKWKVSGPHFAGWELYHLKGSPADPNRIYASQTSGWFGRIIQRSDDGGKPWHRLELLPEKPSDQDRCPKARAINSCMTFRQRPANRSPHTSFMTARNIRGNLSECGIWSHREVIPTRCMQESKTQLCSARRTAEKIGMSFLACADTVPARSGNPAREACACIASFSTPATRSACTSLFRLLARFARTTAADMEPINQGLYSKYIPNPTAEVGHCVHHIAMSPQRPGVLFMQKHWDVMRSDDAGESRTKISGNLRTDFGFVIDVHAHEPETIYVVPIKATASMMCTRAN